MQQGGKQKAFRGGVWRKPPHTTRQIMQNLKTYLSDEKKSIPCAWRDFSNETFKDYVKFDIGASESSDVAVSDRTVLRKRSCRIKCNPAWARRILLTRGRPARAMPRRRWD